MNSMAEAPLKAGDRVRLNAEGREFVRASNADRLGTVRMLSRDGTGAWVRWDGRKSDDGWDVEYLERVDG